jgi:hypothetical protein
MQTNKSGPRHLWAQGCKGTRMVNLAVPEYSRNTLIIMSMSVAFTSGSSVAVVEEDDDDDDDDDPVELLTDGGAGTDLTIENEGMRLVSGVQAIKQAPQRRTALWWPGCPTKKGRCSLLRSREMKRSAEPSRESKKRKEEQRRRPTGQSGEVCGRVGHVYEPHLGGLVCSWRRPRSAPKQ